MSSRRPCAVGRYLNIVFSDPVERSQRPISTISGWDAEEREELKQVGVSVADPDLGGSGSIFRNLDQDRILQVKLSYKNPLSVNFHGFHLFLKMIPTLLKFPV